MNIRLPGAALIAVCALALHRLYFLRHLLPGHDPTLLELSIGLVAVLAGSAGVAMLIIGPALFRRYEWPPAERE